MNEKKLQTTTIKNQSKNKIKYYINNFHNNSFRAFVAGLFFLLTVVIQANAQWSPLVTGLNNSVYAQASDSSNNIYVGGSFTDASGVTVSRIAKWDGTTWSDIGGGFDGDVTALHYTNGLLYAGGTFSTAGGTAANHIAVWNGTTWSALGAGCSSGDVLAITSDTSGNIYAGGTFIVAGVDTAIRVAKWNGTLWSSLGSGIGGSSDYVEALAIYNGSLFAAGRFALAGTNTVNSIARWDGAQWVDLAGGVSGLTGRVSALEVFNGELIAGGTFTSAGSVAANSIAKWNGTAWTAFGGGITGGSAKIKAVEMLYGKLFVGGSFLDAGGIPVLNIAGYDGTNWFAMGAGANSQVNALLAVQKDLYAGGAFTMADTITVNYIAKYATTCATAITSSLTNASCFASCNGTITINASGNAPFTYQWSTVPAQTDSTAINLCPGNYSVIVSDVYGCSISQDSIVIIEPAPLALSFNSGNPLCYQQCSGSAAAVVTNAQGAINYLWNTIPAQTQDSAIGLCAGTYTVQITDSAGCVITDSVTLADPVPNALTFFVADPLCPQQCNGVAVVASTGVPPFSYQWNSVPPQLNDTANGLCAGVYSATVTDSLGCVATNSVQLTDPVPQLINFTTNTPTCFGSCNGTAYVTSTGPAPYTYLWNTVPPQTSQTAINLCEGTFVVSITDSLGCTITDSISIAQPVPNVVNFSVQDVSCAVACNGSASVFSTGFAPFTYSWSNGDSTFTANALCAATYLVTVTDSVGCTATDSVSIGIDQPLPVSFTTGFSACNGSCTGSASATLTGFSNLTYLWSTGDTIATIDSLCPAAYSVTITDSLGCTTTDTVQVINQPVFLNFSSVTPVCFGQCNGSVSINPVGTPPFTLLWSTGDTTSYQLAGLCPATYSVTITDSIGCTGIDSVQLQNPPDISYITTKTDALCFGSCTGHGDITANGGTGALSYVWNTLPPQNIPSVINLCFGYTSYTITDSLGCSKTDSILVFQPDPISMNPSVLQISCNGLCDGFVNLNPLGGTPGFTFNWSNGFTGSFIGNVCAGTYNVTVTDANFCTATATYTLLNPDSLEIVFNITNASCQGCTDGSAFASVTGGTPPYDFLWPGLGVTDSIATNLGAGTYLFCVQDFNNCLLCDSVTISEPNAIHALYDEQLEMIIYPNPFSKQAFIKIKSAYEQNFQISFYDIAGRSVALQADKMQSDANETMYRLNNSNLAPGLYYVRVFAADKIVGIGKFIIR